MTTECRLCDKPVCGRGLCNTHYATHRRKQRAYGRWEPDRVDATATREHLAALRASGLGWKQVTKLSKVPHQTLFEIGCGKRTSVRRRTEQKLLAVPVPDHAGLLHAIAEHGYLPALGSSRRLRALAAIGWSAHSLGVELGIHQRGIQRVRANPPTVTGKFARDVKALFDRLQLTPGPNHKARCHAKRQGWPPPLAWDEDSIDNPTAKPWKDKEPRMTFTERYRELHELGYSDFHAATKLGVKEESLRQQLKRDARSAA